ncbi:MAG: amidohydrolase family protein [Chloroflexi bacterium]|jgi:imidazolonepropionase-like amidohydrolase|nr:amidohydrolase family protein [Chloroflexota bacterium]MBT7080782.1 amidohydrolase family protein [Chloroflexota bacterium]MBT7289722.1 amidohydrolase family protein [Chloroflexota bacterium]
MTDNKPNAVLIKGGTLIDGTGAAPIKNADVLIEGNSIKSVGNNIQTPAGVEVIAAKGKTIMPGLIDSHIHLWGSVAGGIQEWLTRPLELGLLKAANDAKAMLNAGFTTVKCCGSRNGLHLRNSAAEGTINGVPRIIASGHWICQTFGHGDPHILPTEYVDMRTTKHHSVFTDGLLADGVDECIKATRHALRAGADFVKIHVSGGFTSPLDKVTDVQFNLSEIKAISDTAMQVGKYVTAHYQKSIAALRNAILGGVKTIEHALLTDDKSVEMAMEKDCIFVSTIGVLRRSFENMTENAQLMMESYNRLTKAGATFAMGTDNMGIADTAGKNARELELLTHFCDISTMDAIVMATKNGAKACFMGDQAGTIEAGKLADIILVDGDPLKDITILQNADKIKMVMLEGKVKKQA